MRKKIIINADDFGVIPSIDTAVTDLVLAGKVNSVAAFSNHGDAVRNIAELIRKAKRKGVPVDVGAHLTITSGKPVLDDTCDPAYGLCDENGYFNSCDQLSIDAINTGILKKELIAQIDRFTSAGIPIKHLSCHHSILTGVERLFKTYTEVAIETGLNMRSVTILPSWKDNRYIEQLLAAVIRDETRHNGTKKHVAFLNSIQMKFSDFTGGKVKSPDYLESTYYEPVTGVATTSRSLNERVEEKKQQLQHLLQRFASSQNDSMELMVHLSDSVAREETLQYKGIDPRYFDGRVVEYRCLKEIDLDRLFAEHGIEPGNWDAL